MKNPKTGMEPACEGHPQIDAVTDGVRLVSHPPRVHEEPVFEGKDEVDGMGASCYGSVLHDGGVFRMWYQARPRRKLTAGDSVLVGCVESDDGFAWRRPRYGVMEWDGSRKNHLTDLPFHCPSVVIDPTAAPGARYRAFGCTGRRKLADLPEGFDLPLAAEYAYCTAHSADGLRWTVDGPEPAWPWRDVITSAWDPWAGNIMVALKRNGRSAGLFRRRFCTATWAGGKPGPAVTSLIPDEYDDQIARQRGFESADYYGLGLMPGRTVNFGFLWNFRHQGPTRPRTRDFRRVGLIGSVDISLVYQTERGGRWQHLPGRPDWLTASRMPDWARGAIYTASSPIEVGDETRLYFTGTPDRHGWAGEGVDPETFKRENKISRIGLVRWPRGRLTGYESRWRGIVRLQPEKGAGAQAGLALNFTTRPAGRVRAELLDTVNNPIAGYTFDDCSPLAGDRLDAPVRWRGKSFPGKHAVAWAHIELEEAILYGFRFSTRA